MLRRLATLVFLLAAFATVVTIAPRAAFAEKRIALVIGNSAYRTLGPLATAADDAAAMGDLFKAAGFDDVRIASDLDLLDMKRELRAFSEKHRYRRYRFGRFRFINELVIIGHGRGRRWVSIGWRETRRGASRPPALRFRRWRRARA
jgi:Caspase domain